MAVGSGPSRLLVGGFRAADPSFEQYWVRPGGATVLAIAPEDRFTVIDVDGGQVAELTVLAPDGTDAAAAIDARAEAPATVVRALVSSIVDGAQEVVQDLAGRGLDPSRAKAVRLFGEWSPPGSEQSFRADREAVLIVAAPAGRLVDGAPPRATSSSRCTGRGRGQSRRSSSRPRWPNPAWTSGSTSQRPGATRCRPASSSR